jgi:AcrR family transcriptional regulator
VFVVILEKNKNTDFVRDVAKEDFMTAEEKSSPRALVLGAFHALLAEKGYGKLTVQDILERARIGRTTFYVHFTSKEDVLRNSINNLRDWLVWSVEEQEKRTSPLSFTLAYYQHIISHHDIYDHFIGCEDFYTFECYFQRMLKELVLSEIRSSKHSSDQGLKAELIAQYIAGSIWATSTWWLERKQLSAEEMNDCFRNMVLPGLELSLKNL